MVQWFLCKASRNSFLLIALLLFSGSSGIASAQEAELSLYKKIVAAIEKAEPKWKQNRKAIMPNQVIIRWVSGQKRALVSVALLASEEDARVRLRARVNLLEHVPEAKVFTSPLNGFGAEGYMLKTDGVKGVEILFRKGDFVVDVFGPSDEIARRFARHMADALPLSDNPLQRSAGNPWPGRFTAARPEGAHAEPVILFSSR
jgi:hypothetical protein